MLIYFPPHPHRVLRFSGLCPALPLRGHLLLLKIYARGRAKPHSPLPAPKLLPLLSLPHTCPLATVCSVSTTNNLYGVKMYIFLYVSIFYLG